MKKTAYLLLCALLAVSLAGCNNTTEDEGKDASTTAASTTSAAEGETEATVTTAAPVEETTAAETEPPAAPAITDTLEFTSGTASEDRSADLGYKWDKGSSTLTLCGLNMTSSSGVGIKLAGNAKIVIADGTTNNITVTGFSELGCYGILGTEDLTISGKGTLNITSANFESDVIDTGTTAYGICAKDKEIIVEDGTINIVCGTPGQNDASLRNIQGFRCTNLYIDGGKTTITTGDAYTVDTKGAFLDGIYVTGNYNQTAGEMNITIGSSIAVGDELFLENLGICADGDFVMEGGNLEILASTGSALAAKNISFGKGEINAGSNADGGSDKYDKQLYLKVTNN